jgi:indolepyruvate ferredoxin oxidoreductase alpha subunit
MLGAVDTVLDMGASVNIGSGFASTYEQDGSDVPVLATIGDSTFYHSGIHSLMDAVMHNRRFILVLLDNSITAMTGMQPTPEFGKALTGAGTAVTIPELLKACGVQWVKEVDPYRVPEMENLLREARHFVQSPEGGIAVLWVKRPCIICAKSQGMLEVLFPRMKVTAHCVGCKVCLNTFGCPALIWNEQKQQVEINPAICIGCGTCTYVCPQNKSGTGLFTIHEDYLLNEVIL